MRCSDATDYGRNVAQSLSRQQPLPADLADHSRRFLALGLRGMDVDFWKKNDFFHSAGINPQPRVFTPLNYVFAATPRAEHACAYLARQKTET